MTETPHPYPGTAPAPRPPARRSWRLRWSLQTLLGGGVLAALLVVALAAPLLTPHDPLALQPAAAFAPPSAAHPFGTDELGRDLLSRVLAGTRISVGTALAVVVIASVIGVPLGLVAGYTGGWVDAIIMRLIDALLAFPAILLALGLVVVLGQNTINSAVAVAVVSVPAIARLVRASAMQQKAQDYVEAARVIGATRTRVMFRTILPNCLPPLLVQLAITATWAVLLEASLSFLGLGTQPPTPSWGQMLNTSRNYLYRAPWYGLFPGVFLMVLVVALNSLADVAQRHLSRGRIR